VLWLAVELWQKGGRHGDGDTPVTVGGVFVTTLLNPKAIVFAFTLLPLVPAHELGPWLAALAGLILVAGSAWIFLGAAIRHGTSMSPQASYRAGAVGLLVLVTAAGSRAAGFV
jgi:threonine/homoserine/homoserine lactone efflux protein